MAPGRPRTGTAVTQCSTIQYPQQYMYILFYLLCEENWLEGKGITRGYHGVSYHVIYIIAYRTILCYIVYCASAHTQVAIFHFH